MSNLWSIQIVAAMANKNVIGRNDELPWGHIPEDMAHFKKVTQGSYVVMGYNTVVSISNKLGRRENLLPGRTVCVLTRNPEKLRVRFPGCIALPDVDSVLRLRESRSVSIAGGQQVYELFINNPEVRTLHLTRIFGDFHGNKFFPEMPLGEWDVKKYDVFPAAEGRPSLAFQLLIRNR